MKYQFGEFVLDTGTGSLIGPEGPVSLRRQTFRLLEVLLEHAPELVDHNSLLDQAWGRTALSPNVLPQAISELRQALGDQPQAPRYIETLHRRGYRIACPVEINTQPGPPASTPHKPNHAPAEKASPWLATTTALMVLVVLSIGYFWWQESADRRWLEREALPQIRAEVENDVAEAWRLARQARQRVRSNPQLDQLWLDISLPAALDSQPEGALIEMRAYHGGDSDWIALGRTPLEDLRLPLAQMRLRASLDGYVPLEAAPNLLPLPEPITLHRPEDTPDGMVFVSGGPVTYHGVRQEVPDFWIARYEVTNEEYLAFVEDNGYHRPEFWLEPVVIDERELGFGELMQRLVDQTGRPGPATWMLGHYPDGLDRHPVNGISWYEAMAYARWAGKQLPSVFHWSRAAGLGTAQAANFSGILDRSNFSRRGTVAVGSLAGLGAFGTYDMAGNVREWCLNASGPLRHSLGAGYNDAPYQFRDVNAFDPLERSSAMGLRLMLQESPFDDALAMEFDLVERVINEPVDDQTFALYARLYDYDPTPLEARIESIDDNHRAWRRERISFAATYPGERVSAQLFLPRHASPPYQTVVHWPGGDAMLVAHSRDAGLIQIEPFLRSGRAVLYPVYQGTFERRQTLLPGPMTTRDLLIQQMKDMRRSIDYLETRDDIDTDRLLFHGISFGGIRAPYALAVEPRFRTAILVSAGLVATSHLPPEIHQPDYIARVSLPILMINGRHDFTFPYETAQRPFFDLLATPPEHKRLIVIDAGHLPQGYTEVSRAILDWTDQWLGEVPPGPVPARYLAAEHSE